MNVNEAKAALKKYFGYESFRPMQLEIIESIYAGKDALVLMPTGGGKSVCFQIPAVTMPGACVVVSPLISLMKDQVEGLRANGIRASYLNSTQGLPEQRVIEDEFYDQQIDLLYVSPEKLVSQSFLPLLQRSKVNLFAIDEAHCISAWGHDFRPEYTQMKFLKQQFPNIPIVALTATADKVTRRDMVQQLRLPNPEIFISSFDRPNLSLEVRPGQKRFEQIVNFILERPNQSGIIYCLSRKSTEDVARKLKERRINADYYHAKLSASERSRVQEDFINDNIPIICATVAFGMGIDKSNVRWIIHYNLPKNMESYYQEIGRAGRDGVKADTLLFYSYGDVMVLRDILEKNESENAEIQLAKLDRMRQYAESLACRRRILLNYFSESLEKNCGNCDICNNPPRYFDGTTIAQKALSAIYRLRQKVAMGMVIDVLRGSGKKEIFQRGYDQIKTYGAGRDLPYGEWQNYFLQLLNLGYIEIDHEAYNAVKLTPLSKKVLFEKEKVQLVQMATVKQRQEAQKKAVKPKTERQRVRDELFEQLRQLRRQLAQERGVPPYIIFSDATLEEMAARRPTSDAAFRNISGVGERKLQLYGNHFMDAIIEFIRENQQANKGKSATYQETLALYRKGQSVEKIAEQRQLTPGTIFSHLAILYERGEAIDIGKYIQEQDVKKILEATKYLERPVKLKAINDYFDGQYSYEQIRFALAYERRAELS
ncbi:MAG: DNA helicase RecQ [Bacteroidota bacterium]